METKTYERQDVQPFAAGPHKLAHEWSVKLLVDGASGLMDNGKMDFRNMNAQGHLTNGAHVIGTANTPIDADATPVTLPDGTQTFAVVVKATDGSAVYKGMLLRENAGDMTIVGVFKFNPGFPTPPTPPPGHGGTLPAPGPGQDEGTWVITKP